MTNKTRSPIDNINEFKIYKLMKPIERLKMEVLVNLNAMSKDYPYTYKEIMHQLSTRDAWTRLDYIVAMDIETYGKVAWVGDAFYDDAELEARKLKEATSNG